MPTDGNSSAASASAGRPTPGENAGKPGQPPHAHSGPGSSTQPVRRGGAVLLGIVAAVTLTAAAFFFFQSLSRAPEGPAVVRPGVPAAPSGLTTDQLTAPAQP